MTLDDRSSVSRRPRFTRDLRDRIARRATRDEASRSPVSALPTYGPDVFRHRFIRPVQPWERLTGH